MWWLFLRQAGTLFDCRDVFQASASGSALIMEFVLHCLTNNHALSAMIHSLFSCIQLKIVPEPKTSVLLSLERLSEW